MEGLGFKFKGFQFRVQVLGCRADGLKFRIHGSGLG